MDGKVFQSTCAAGKSDGDGSNGRDGRTGSVWVQFVVSKLATTDCTHVPLLLVPQLPVLLQSINMRNLKHFLLHLRMGTAHFSTLIASYGVSTVPCFWCSFRLAESFRIILVMLDDD